MCFRRSTSLKIVLSAAGERVAVFIIHDLSLFLSHNIAVVATSPIMQGRIQNFGKGPEHCDPIAGNWDHARRSEARAELVCKIMSLFRRITISPNFQQTDSYLVGIQYC